MNLALDKLEKILKLEQEQGFRDKAVIGGLARFADAWRAQARSEMDDEAWVAQIAEQMESYSQLTTQEERQACLESLRIILRSGPGSGYPPTAQPQSEAVTGPALPAVGSRREPSSVSRASAQERQRPRPQVKPEDMELNSPITVLSGIGPTQSKRLARLGMRKIRETS